MAKKSGLNDELTVAYDALIALRDTLTFEEVDEGASVSEAGDEERVVRSLETVLLWMSKKLEQPQSEAPLVSLPSHLPTQPYNCLVADPDLLRKSLHLAECGGGMLAAKDDKPRVQASGAVQPRHIWSSKNLHSHLTRLEQSVPQVEGSARSWIDAFFFRASAMVGEGKRMILNIEHPIPHTTCRPTAMTILAGQVDYSAFVANDHIARSIMDDARMMSVCQLIKGEHAAAAQGTRESTTARLLPSGFFVVEAKPTDARPRLMDHISQAVSELYACATLLHQKFLRGALTNGHDWVFIIVRLNEDAPGGRFKRSGSLTLRLDKEGRAVTKYSADRIAAILSYWIEHSFEDVGAGDWFEPFSWET
ncbi:hypothetical protein BDZ89DRAFT_1069869 [Hymenopellis radicata]|nr:hypothetical protein BDZ89DRAFT_1069869 [Hymenopellis radicata]